jgi:HSP20 family protein
MTVIIKRNGGRSGLVPYYRPWSMIRDLEELYSGMLDSWRPSELSLGNAPQMDVYEENDNLVLKTELPGIERKDLDVKLEGDTITIKAEKKEEVKEDATHHTSERYYGHYYRSVQLPFPVKEDSVTATLDKGVLEVKLPKAEVVEPKRIEVKAQLPKGRRKAKKEK